MSVYTFSPCRLPRAVHTTHTTVLSGFEVYIQVHVPGTAISPTNQKVMENTSLVHTMPLHPSSPPLTSLFPLISLFPFPYIPLPPPHNTEPCTVLDSDHQCCILLNNLLISHDTLYPYTTQIKLSKYCYNTLWANLTLILESIPAESIKCPDLGNSLMAATPLA